MKCASCRNRHQIIQVVETDTRSQSLGQIPVLGEGKENTTQGFSGDDHRKHVCGASSKFESVVILKTFIADHGERA